MVQDTQTGLSADKIPLEGQIIRVADEFDAIVSKRQYKSHIGIADTLKILVENSKPIQNISNVSALAELSKSAKMGKINPRILKHLFSIVIADTEYEISQIYDYLDFLKDNIKRLKQIDSYNEKMLKQTKEQKRNYYKEGMDILFENGESPENYKEILNEYERAYIVRKESIDKLFSEIKNIKKLKV